MKTITKKQWINTYRDYKSVIKGKRYILELTPRGTALVPVKVRGMPEPEMK